MKFEYHNPVHIIFGEGEVQRAGSEARKLGRKALLVSYREHDFFADLLANLEGAASESGRRGRVVLRCFGQPQDG